MIEKFVSYGDPVIDAERRRGEVVFWKAYDYIFFVLGAGLGVFFVLSPFQGLEVRENVVQFFSVLWK